LFKEPFVRVGDGDVGSFQFLKYVFDVVW